MAGSDKENEFDGLCDDTIVDDQLGVSALLAHLSGEEWLDAPTNIAMGRPKTVLLPMDLPLQAVEEDIDEPDEFADGSCRFERPLPALVLPDLAADFRDVAVIEEDVDVELPVLAAARVKWWTVPMRMSIILSLSIAMSFGIAKLLQLL